ncbi:MAG: hypothetical protein M1337_05000 [Actinobacteria bacterium]|nr:hypothetical protein [Actinomycetota bacterium]
MKPEHHPVPWYLWPFVGVWRLVATIVGLTGRLVAVLLGFILLVIGFVVTLTIVGAIIGLPLMLFGILLMLRGLF